MEIPTRTFSNVFSIPCASLFTNGFLTQHKAQSVLNELGFTIGHILKNEKTEVQRNKLVFQPVTMNKLPKQVFGPQKHQTILLIWLTYTKLKECYHKNGWP